MTTGASTEPVPDSSTLEDYAFSRDGTRLAYTIPNGTGLQDLYVAAGDGTGARKIADDAGGWAAWSPDGRTLLYETHNRLSAGLVTIGADGANRKVVVQAQTRPGEHWLQFVVSNGWSPDGSRLEFGLWRNPASDAVGP